MATSLPLAMRLILKAVGLAVALALFAGGCSHAKKKTTPELSQLRGKKVALIEIDGEATARSVIEVALVNQLVARGTFILVSKQDVEAARVAPTQDPTDWLGIARRAGADYALKAKVAEFSADNHEGYSTEKVRDSVIAAEQGEAASTTDHLYKVKSMTGKVRVRLEFDDVPPPGGQPKDPRSGDATAEETVTADSRTEAAHLPPKLRFLEGVAGEAFQKFFEENQ